MSLPNKEAQESHKTEEAGRAVVDLQARERELSIAARSQEKARQDLLKPLEGAESLVV